MKRKYKIGLLILSSVMLLTACNGEKTKREDDTVRNNESTIEKENELPEYAFAIKGYVEIQEGEIESINVEDYLPNEAMTLTYEDMTAEQSLQYYYNIYPEKGKVRYEGESDLDVLANSGGESRYTSTGYYYYDTSADCLAEISSLPGMKEQDVAYLIPMGKSLKLNEFSSIQNVSYLFTVSCEAGVYEDCIAVNKTVTLNDAETAIVTYYAKGIGAVLTVTNYPNGGMDFRVTDILTKVESTVVTDYTHDETNDLYSDIDYNWWENKCYVSDTTGGKFYGFRYSEGGEPYFTFGMCCVKIENGNAKFMKDDNRGNVIKYTFQTMKRIGNSMVYENYYVLYILERDIVEAFNEDESYSDRFYYDNSFYE